MLYTNFTKYIYRVFHFYSVKQCSIIKNKKTNMIYKNRLVNAVLKSYNKNIKILNLFN